MYRKFVAVLVVVFLAGLACLAYPPCPAPSVKGEVLRVVDGDTIEVKILSVPPELSATLRTGSVIRVRYIGIDAPEPGQPGSTEATEINRLLVGGRTVWLELDGTIFDTYGRLLAYVYLDEKGYFMVNMALVTSPLFKAYPFDNTPRYNECFKQADINPEICSTCWVRPPRAEVVAAAKDLDRSYDDAIRHPEKWVGQIVMFEGTVLEVSHEKGEYRLRVGSLRTLLLERPGVIVEWRSRGFLKGDSIRIYGRVVGLTQVTVRGVSQMAPVIRAYYIDRFVSGRWEIDQGK